MARPDRTIQTYSVDGQSLQCHKCERRLDTKDIAMFLRTKPTDAFTAWCPTCTYWVAAKAAEALEAGELTAVTVSF
jgi:hypothetical protein